MAEPLPPRPPTPNLSTPSDMKEGLLGLCCRALAPSSEQREELPVCPLHNVEAVGPANTLSVAKMLILRPGQNYLTSDGLK